MKFSEVGVRRRRHRGNDSWVGQASRCPYVEICLSHPNGQLSPGHGVKAVSTVRQRGRQRYLTEGARKTSWELESSSKVSQGLGRLLCGDPPAAGRHLLPRRATTSAEGRAILCFVCLFFNEHAEESLQNREKPLSGRGSLSNELI